MLKSLAKLAKRSSSNGFERGTRIAYSRRHVSPKCHGLSLRPIHRRRRRRVQRVGRFNARSLGDSRGHRAGRDPSATRHTRHCAPGRRHDGRGQTRQASERRVGRRRTASAGTRYVVREPRSDLCARLRRMWIARGDLSRRKSQRVLRVRSRAEGRMRSGNDRRRDVWQLRHAEEDVLEVLRVERDNLCRPACELVLRRNDRVDERRMRAGNEPLSRV